MISESRRDDIDHFIPSGFWLHPDLGNCYNLIIPSGFFFVK
jgi:hypothetical protein